MNNPLVAHKEFDHIVAVFINRLNGDSFRFPASLSSYDAAIVFRNAKTPNPAEPYQIKRIEYCNRTRHDQVMMELTARERSTVMQIRGMLNDYNVHYTYASGYLDNAVYGVEQAAELLQKFTLKKGN